MGAYDPAGDPVSEHSVTCLLRVLRDLLEGGAVSAFGTLLRSGNVLDALKADAVEAGVENFNELALLRSLDDILNYYLPEGLGGLAEVLSTAPKGSRDVLFAHNRVRQWVNRFEVEDLGVVLPDFLGWAYSGREFRSDRPEDSAMAEVAKLVSNALESMDSQIFSRDPIR